jgi:phage-related protein
MSNIVDFDASMLLDIDVDAVYPKFGDTTLKLSDLDNIDWDLVASSVLGITDPIGQIRDWLAGVLSGFFDSLKKFFEELISPIRNAITSLLGTVKSVVVDPILSALKWISDNFFKLAGAVSDLTSKVVDTITKLPDYVRGFIDTVSRVFGDLVDRVRSGFSWFIDQVAKIPDFLRGLVENMSRVLGDLAERVRAGFSWFIEQVAKLPDTIRDLLGKVAGVIGDLVDRVRSGFSWFLEQVGKIPDFLRDLMGKATALFGDLADKIRSGFAWFIEQVSKIPDLIRDLIGKAAALFGDLADKIRGGFTWFIEQVSRLPDTVRDLLSRVAGVIGDLLDRVRAGFGWFIDQVSRLPDLVKGVVERITGVLVDLAERAGRGLTAVLDVIGKALTLIRDTLTTILGDVATGVGGVVEWIRNGFGGLGTTISSWFEGARGWFEAATGALTQLGSILTGFVNAVMQLPERLAYAFKGVVGFFNNLWTGLQSFIKDPAGWLGKYVIEPLWSGLQRLGGKLWEGLQWLWSMLVKGAEWLWGTLKTAGGWLVNALRGVYDALHGFFAGVADAIGKAGEAIYGFFVNAFSRLADAVKKAVESLVKPVISEFMKAVGWGSPPGLTIGNFAGAWVTSFAWSIPLYVFALSMEIPLRAAAFVMKGIAMSMRDLDWKIRISLRPLGIGAETEFNVAKAIGAALYNFSEEIMKHADKFYEPFWTGLGFWYGRYASMLLTYNLRNFMPIEMPTLRESEEMWNKLRATRLAKYEIPKDVLGTPRDAEEAILNFLKIRGYSDYLLKLAFASEEEFYLEISDRFGAKRRIPLADAWKTPPPSDVVRMMIRDVFPSVDDFVAAMRTVGFNKDTAILYYYLHYRYPAPERLAEFYWRGLAGVLWYPDALFEAELAKSLGITVTARAPRELNFDFKSLSDAMYKYMKWHDYAPFPWIDRFTTDKAIVTELMADLPDKVDFRWMTRWGILEHLSKLGVGVTTTVEKIVDAISSARGDELLSKQVVAGISLDVSLLSRFLVARGMHPYFATIASVAEAHTMLADEMTLVRTGFLNIYRWGMSDVNTLEQLMSGLITIQFTTAYLDLARGEWKTITYNKPVLWLPAERRLLQLRSAVDRYYELWRDYVREVERGVRTLALLSRSDVESVKKHVGQLKLPEDVAERVKQLLSELEKTATSEDLLRQYYEVVSARLSSEVKAITGRDIAFTIDQAYVDTWIKYAELTRVIEAKHWVRTFATRIMGWLFYRVSYGWVSPEEMKTLTTMLLARGWVSVEEKEFLDVVAEWVYRVAVKELVPSPSTLATFAEYMVIDVKVVEDVLSKYNVPRGYWDLWKTYIAVKPVKADYKAVLNTALKALRYTAISRDYYESLLKSAEAHGFTPAEINLINLRSELELLIDEAKLWRPTLLTLISMIEYVPEAVKLLEYYRVDPVFKPVIERYALVKPLADEARVLVNALYRAKRYVAISKELEDRVLTIVKQFGVTDVELYIRDLALELTVLVDEAREYVPTPSTLATMAEYLPEVRKYLAQVFEARRVRGVWAEVWTRYIYLRPVFDEVRRWASAMFTLAEYLIIDVKQLDPVFKILMTYGWEELEVTIATKTILAEQVRHAFNAVLGAPRTIAGMARYTDKAADWAYSRAARLIDALPLDNASKELLKQMWREYIMSYQAYPEIRSYMTELINAYADGVLDDKGLEDELNYLRKIGVPELRLAFVRRTAMLRRTRRLARAGY